jgi:L-amino acid N-acyltransferase YncA
MAMTLIDPHVRPATPADAAACVAIYRPYVEGTAISFETQVPTVSEMAERIVAYRRDHEWLVLESNSAVIGYAYANQFNPRPAYRWSVESTVYVGQEQRGSGAGRVLYTELLRRLNRRGFLRVFAAIAQPNEPSNALHRAFGFEPVGLLRRVGWKNGQWHDVAWVQLDLADPADANAPPPVLS